MSDNITIIEPEDNTKLAYREFRLKKRNGSFRRICAPNKRLLAYQRARLKKLYEVFYEASEAYEVDNAFHGFLPNRNCVTAGREHIGKAVSISMDISNFFDSVTKEMLEDYPLTQDMHFYHKEGHCAQGFATSPILANIALIPAIAELTERIQGAITVYADDICISINKDDHDSVNNVISFVTSVIESYGFSINPKKTRVRYHKAGFRHMLGLSIGLDHITVTRKFKRKIRAARHQGNHSSLGGLVTWSRILLPKALR